MDQSPTPSIPVPGGNGDEGPAPVQTAEVSARRSDVTGTPDGHPTEWWELPRRQRPHDRRLLEQITPYERELESRYLRETAASGSLGEAPPAWLGDAREMLGRARELAV